MSYQSFLDAKAPTVALVGVDVNPADLSAHLFDWQREIVVWALARGRACIWSDTGTGKTRMQLAWADELHRREGVDALILAPLAVSAQTVREGEEIGVPVTICKNAGDVRPGVNISNYERLHHFDPERFGALVVDECFAAGTPIDTPSGVVPIERLRVGDRVRHANGVGRIRAAKQRRLWRLAVVHVGELRAVCSPNHPWLTRRGWVAAQHLRPDDTLVEQSEAVRMVRDDVRASLTPQYQDAAAAVLRATLLSELEDDPTGDQGKGAQSGSCGEAWPSKIATPLGLQEGEADNARVDCVEVLESGSPGFARLSGGRDTITLYDLDVEGHPSFSVGGYLVHNSAILRDYSGTVRQQIQRFADRVRYRLACTATPVPNDLLEITNHSEFVGEMVGKHIISRFFVADDASLSHSYRLKGHAVRDFYAYCAEWALALRKPSDLGYGDAGYDLPPLNTHLVHVDHDTVSEDRLFGVDARSLAEHRQVKRESIPERVRRAADLVAAEPGEQWLIWCGLNAESEALTKAIPGAVEVKGSDSIEHKEGALLGFSEGRIRVLITKSSIAGHGMNFQRCARMIFIGLGHSWEGFYQAVRRCWRYGQARAVEVYIVMAQAESEIIRTIEHKERQASEMMDAMVDAMGALQRGRAGAEDEYAEAPKEDLIVPDWLPGDAPPEPGEVASQRVGSGWAMYWGDSVEALRGMPKHSAGLAVFSPPFPGMYVYTATDRDVGNSASIEELVEHFRLIAQPMRNVLMPGRICAVHLMQLPAYETRDGYAGIRDFRGPVIEMMQREGYHYASEVTIDKNPQIQATRHKEHGLLFKTLSTDASRLRMALADYLLYFRTPGENPTPIRAGQSAKYNGDEGWVSQQEWIEWAAPVWYRRQAGLPGGISETDVLNVRQARDDRDERHLCPLQLGVIERVVKLYSNPGEVVLSPFAGIGSEGHEALRHDRRFVGVELKRSYFKTACHTLEVAEGQLDLLADAAP